MAILDHIILNENAYFYKKEDSSKFITRKHINEIFTKCSEDKLGKKYLLDERKKSMTIGTINIEYSICIFKLEYLPNIIDEEISPKWREQKLAYLLIADFKDYIFISKRNISGIDKLLYKGLTVIDYSILNTIFIDSNTSLEKFSLNNTSIVQDSIRGKTIEALDLKKSFSPYGAGRYVLNSLRVNNEDEKTSIAFNTSRITKFGEKKYIDELLVWAMEVIEKIKTYNPISSFLDVFATAIDYESTRDTLVPISLLFNLRKIHEDIESGRLLGCELLIPNLPARQIPLKKILKALKNVFDIEAVYYGLNTNFHLKNNFAHDLVLNINKKSITLSSVKAQNLILQFQNGKKSSLLSYFNYYNDYIINFEDLSLVYTNRKLFKDSKLINYIDNFIEAFEENDLLNIVTSEKGTFSNTSTQFTSDSIFSFIENEITNTTDYSFLDDLGNEWADYISIEDHSLHFIHAKHGDALFSASSFHEIVGQALKNIGNMIPSDDELDKKSILWSENFNIDSSKTAINRLRNGPSVAQGISAYKKLLLNPNLKREIFLVVNFISKNSLQDRLTKLKNGTSFSEKNQVIQILWLLSGLINSCQENGIGVHIICKP
ncbi:hypothetical protein SOM12_06655 [Flavobacterium sp. CFBP9031]|uniref:hypothetical protein n=1 Tax=Flavobacterium sp. CFBP9031 TaxID=3096538 RepID=UPI002A69EF8F|nr:hypothetical protein [Flavobacterium sp. CFBP9031]MDY0987089.1 hypothetical protein [Flavobacterium sp. CFBP9031]